MVVLSRGLTGYFVTLPMLPHFSKIFKRFLLSSFIAERPSQGERSISKLDLKEQYKDLYSPSKEKVTLVDVPSLEFLMIDGHGDPNTAQEYRDAVEALYGVAYKLKFTSKKEQEMDYVVPPPEGLWWADDMETFTARRDKSAWDWTMMILWLMRFCSQSVAKSPCARRYPRRPRLPWG
jgi:hypothetical protein